MRVLILLKEFNNMRYQQRAHLLRNYNNSDLIEAIESEAELTLNDVKYIKDYNQTRYNYEYIPFIELDDKMINKIKG